MNNTGKSLFCLGFFVFFIFTACSNKSGDVSKKRDNYTGTWDLEKTTCDGEEILTSGLSERFTLDMENQRGSNIVTSSNCIARTNFRVKKTGGVLTFENSSYICSPGKCSVSYSVSLDNKRVAYRHSCPDDFPSNARIKARLAVNGNHFTTELTSTRGMNCVNTYRRRD